MRESKAFRVSGILELLALEGLTPNPTVGTERQPASHEVPRPSQRHHFSHSSCLLHRNMSTIACGKPHPYLQRLHFLILNRLCLRAPRQDRPPGHPISSEPRLINGLFDFSLSWLADRPLLGHVVHTCGLQDVRRHLCLKTLPLQQPGGLERPTRLHSSLAREFRLPAAKTKMATSS